MYKALSLAGGDRTELHTTRSRTTKDDSASVSRGVLAVDFPMLLYAGAPIPTAPRSPAIQMAEISRVLVCVGHLCECQGADGIGARALLQELKDTTALKAPVQETVCLGMCGMGAMGCVEYADGSESLVAGRTQMLSELNFEASASAPTKEECATEAATGSGGAIERILVCTGRMCQREKGGGMALLEGLQQATSVPCEAVPCLGSCGSGSMLKIEKADGCEEEMASTVTRLPRTLEKLGLIGGDRSRAASRASVPQMMIKIAKSSSFGFEDFEKEMIGKLGLEDDGPGAAAGDEADEEGIQRVAPRVGAEPTSVAPADLEPTPRSGVQEWGRWSHEDDTINLDLFLPSDVRAKELQCAVTKDGELRVERASDGSELLAGRLALPVDRVELIWLLEEQDDGRKLLCIEIPMLPIDTSTRSRAVDCIFDDSLAINGIKSPAVTGLCAPSGRTQSGRDEM